jgi:hypothetical protein
MKTRAASPTAAPTEALVDAMADATPCSRSATPVPAAMNVRVKTVPSPMLMVTRPGMSVV